MDAESPAARLAILDAAESLFATRGFAATTIKQIGSSAGQNPALIYYYFDSKASLYRHTLERVFGEIAAEGETRLAAGTDPENVVRAVIDSQVTVLLRRPHLSLLLTRELIDWQAARAESAIRGLAATLFTRLQNAIERGRDTGLFRKAVDARFAAISTISQVAYLLLARPVAGILLGRGLGGPTQDDIAAFGAHAAEFALAALRSPEVSREGGAAARSLVRPTLQRQEP